MANNVDVHELITKLKDMAIELGRVPTRQEFRKEVKNAGKLITDHFGSYGEMLIAAGLGNVSRAKKITNEIFIRDVVETIENYSPREIIAQPRYRRTLVIGDTHFPFVSQRTLEAIYEHARIHKPELIIQVGDLYDMYAHSKFPKSLNLYMPQQEEQLGRKMAEEMWKTLKEICPDAECIQLKGNHDIRPLKRTIEAVPSVEHWVEKILNELMSFDGVTLITDSRQEYIVDGIEFLHGYRTKIGDHMAYTLMNSVCGHIHRGGTFYRRFKGQTFWELNAGFVGDPESKALGYTAQKLSNYTLGFGWIDENGPRFIHL